MWGLTSFLFVYVLGGLTFLPGLILAVLIHAHFTFPYRDENETLGTAESLLRDGDDAAAIKAASQGLDEKFQSRGSQDSDVAAGYFAVCREYVPGGVNGKPPERTTPAGSTVISSPSPSVYQSMYRSIFDRKPTASPLENKGAGKPQKKGGNVFYVVLRHSHLMLFDDDDQLEVRYVISLSHYDVSIYGGGELIPDGELFIKRNALCLSRKVDVGEMTADGTASKPFYLFADNTSDKEDFYFAMLKNQERRPEATNNPPVPLQFDVKHIIQLVQRLHSSEEHLQTRWINAILGRIFLGLYKTSDVENFLRAKVTKKISRVKTPSYLSKIVLRHVDMGEGAPYITNPRLKDLTVDGDCSIEADVMYTGCFRLEIAATARIELGSRFKAREVNLVLAVVIKKIEGHMILRIKPPPSNRIWYTFQSMPLVEMSIEPIVSSRQITYTLILRQIENRIKEVIAESIVMPFWDDTAFFSTEGKKWRGGIWVDDINHQASNDPQTTAAEEGDVDAVDDIEHNNSETLPSGSILPIEKSMSTPPLESSQPASIFALKAAKSVFNLGTKAGGSSTSVDTKSSVVSRALRTGSFPSASSPIVGADIINAGAFKPAAPPDHSHAASAMAAISAKSQPVTPVGSPSRPSVFDKSGSFSSTSSESQLSVADVNISHSGDAISAELNPLPTVDMEDTSSVDGSPEKYPPSPARTSSTSILSDGARSFGSFGRKTTATSNKSAQSLDSTGQPKRVMLTTVANAAASAKRWGLNALAARNAEPLSTPDSIPNVNEPMGRGRPLPPPGIPLPLPNKKTKTAPIPVPKRKVLSPHLPPPGIPPRYSNQKQPKAEKRPMPPPPLPKRRNDLQLDDVSDGIFVVAAPESEPTTPLSESKPNYMQPWVDDVDDEDLATESKVDERTGSAAPLEPTHPPEAFSSQDVIDPSPPSLPRRRYSKSMSSSPEEDNKKLPTWLAAQEEEARAKSMWVDEDSGNVHQ